MWRVGHDDPAYANLSVDTAKDDACNRNSSDPSVKMEDEIQVGIFEMFESVRIICVPERKTVISSESFQVGCWFNESSN